MGEYYEVPQHYPFALGRLGFSCSRKNATLIMGRLLRNLENRHFNMELVIMRTRGTHLGSALRQLEAALLHRFRGKVWARDGRGLGFSRV